LKHKKLYVVLLYKHETKRSNQVLAEILLIQEWRA